MKSHHIWRRQNLKGDTLPLWLLMGICILVSALLPEEGIWQQPFFSVPGEHAFKVWHRTFTDIGIPLEEKRNPSLRRAETSSARVKGRVRLFHLEPLSTSCLYFPLAVTGFFCRTIGRTGYRCCLLRYIHHQDGL